MSAASEWDPQPCQHSLLASRSARHTARADRPLARWPAFRFSAAALAIYLILAIALLWRGLFAGGNSIAGNHGDPSLIIWDLAWVPFAISHHLDPLVTSYQNYPDGVNLMWNVSMIFPSLALAPVTEVFGSFASYNTMIVLGFALSGWCAYHAVRRYTGRWLAAFIGGLLYAFSPFMYAQSSGHPMLSLALFPPLLVVFADEILARQRPRAALVGGLLGFTAAAQLLTGEELLVMTAVMGCITLLILALVSWGRPLGEWGYILRASGTAIGTFVVLTAYPLYVQLFGPERASGALQPLDRYVTPPLALVVPTTSQLFRPFATTSVLDSGVYLGIPLIVVVLITLLWLRIRRMALVSGIVLACTILLSLGGHVPLPGGGSLSLPWAIANRLPVLDDILPVRLMLFGYLALALLIALFVDRVLAQRSPGICAIGMAATAAALLPLLPSPAFVSTRFPVPAYLFDAHTAPLSPPGSTLIAPYDGYDQSVWQAASGMAFVMQPTLWYVAGPHGPICCTEGDALQREVFRLSGEQGAAPQLSPGQRSAYLNDLSHDDIRSIVIAPSSGQARVVGFLTDLLGTSGRRLGGVVVWDNVQPPHR